MLLPLLSSFSLGVCFISMASELGLWLPLWATLVHDMKWLSIKKREREGKIGKVGKDWRERSGCGIRLVSTGMV